MRTLDLTAHGGALLLNLLVDRLRLLELFGEHCLAVTLLLERPPNLDGLVQRLLCQQPAVIMANTIVGCAI